MLWDIPRITHLGDNPPPAFASLSAQLCHRRLAATGGERLQLLKVSTVLLPRG